MRTGVAKPANPRLLTLAEAEAFVASVRQSEPDEARRILLEALQNSAIVARGAHPMNAARDTDWAWEHSGPPRVGVIPSGTWFLAVDWTLGRVSRYRHITIAETDLTALFTASRRAGTPPALNTVRRSVKDYVASEREAQRAPSQSGCLAYMKIHLSGATRAQILPVYRGLEPPKPPGRPRRKIRSNNSPFNSPFNSPNSIGGEFAIIAHGKFAHKMHSHRKEEQWRW